MWTFQSEEALKDWAAQLAIYLTEGTVIVLHGDLGAGKTTFTKGLAKGLEIETTIKSPTYTLIKEYTTGRLPLYHMDMYRLEDIGGDGLGLEDYFEGDGISVVEWGEFIQEELPHELVNIFIERVPQHENYRTVTLQPTEKYQDLLKQLK